MNWFNLTQADLKKWVPGFLLIQASKEIFNDVLFGILQESVSGLRSDTGTFTYKYQYWYKLWTYRLLTVVGTKGQVYNNVILL